MGMFYLKGFAITREVIKKKKGKGKGKAKEREGKMKAKLQEMNI